MNDTQDRRRVLVARKSSSRLDAILPAIFGPLRDDMAVVAACYTKEELGVIFDFLASSREVLLANTARVEREFEPK
jgi:hypothetical protein